MANQKEMMKSHFPVGTEPAGGRMGMPSTGRKSQQKMYETTTKSQFVEREGLFSTKTHSTRPPSAVTYEKKYRDDVPLKILNVDWGATACPMTKSTFVQKQIQRVTPCNKNTSRDHSWSFGMDPKQRWTTSMKAAHRGIDFTGPADIAKQAKLSPESLGRPPPTPQRGTGVPAVRSLSANVQRQNSSERNRLSSVPL